MLVTKVPNSYFIFYKERKHYTDILDHETTKQHNVRYTITCDFQAEYFNKGLDAISST